MKGTVVKSVILQPMTVPNYVIQHMPPGKRDEGFREAPKYALSELDANTLSLLCDEFRANVFQKAGIKDPRLD